MKERDDDPGEALLAEPVAPTPVTARGLERLRRAFDATPDGPGRAELAKQIASAVVADLPVDRTTVALGATVSVAGAAKRERRFTVVGEYEIDVASGLIGAASPLAQALMGKRAGDAVVWHRPAGDLDLTITSVRYEDDGSS